MQTIIYPLDVSDLEAVISPSRNKRLEYEKAQPQLWRYAGERGDNLQEQWLEELLNNQDYSSLVAKDQNQEILGSIIGRLVTAAEVYSPDGLTLMIDDFCVKVKNLWSSVGVELIKTIKIIDREKGASPMLVVSGAHDNPKHQFLVEQNLSIASD